jgi:hypothetical protein
MIWTIVSGVIALVAAALGLRPFGRFLRTRPVSWYLAAMVATGVVAMVVMLASAYAVPPLTDLSDALFGLGVGFGFGGLAGIRYGYKGLFEIATGKGRA